MKTIQKILSSSDVPAKTLQLLIAHAVSKPHTFLYSHPEYELSSEESTKLDSYLKRYENHEPLQYITNTREFYGLDFYVDNRVLIPRPETEDLVEECLTYIRNSHEDVNVVEVGTGSGAISIALAKHTDAKVTITAIEVSPEALQVAQQNAKINGVDKRITFIQGDLLQPLINKKYKNSVDLIVANLPYISEHVYEALEPHIRDHEPRIALVGGPTGVELYDILFEQARSILKPDGVILYELDGRVCVK